MADKKTNVTIGVKEKSYIHGFFDGYFSKITESYILHYEELMEWIVYGRVSAEAVNSYKISDVISKEKADLIKQRIIAGTYKPANSFPSIAKASKKYEIDYSEFSLAFNSIKVHLKGVKIGDQPLADDIINGLLSVMQDESNKKSVFYLTSSSKTVRASNYIDRIIAEYNKKNKTAKLEGDVKFAVENSLKIAIVNQVLDYTKEQTNVISERRVIVEKQKAEEKAKREAERRAQKEKEKNLSPKAVVEPVKPVIPVVAPVPHTSTHKGGSEDMKTKVAFALLDKDNTIIASTDEKGKNIDEYLASLSEEKRTELLNKTVSFVVLGVFDEKGNTAPLTKEIVNKIPAPHVQVTNNVTKIAAGTFVGGGVEQVSFSEAYINPLNTVIEAGAFDNNVRVLACGKQENTIKDGEVVKTAPKFKYYEFTPDAFVNSVNNNSLHKIINRVVFTPYATPKPVTYVEKREKLEPTTTRSKVAAKPVDKNLYVPFALDHDRTLNSRFGKVVKWIIKNPVWSIFAAASATLFTMIILAQFIPAVAAALQLIQLVSVSVVVVSLVVAGAVKVGKWIVSLFSKRYRSLFLKEKAQKTNMKIRKRLQKIHENLHKVEQIIKDEVGLLHGNATKEKGRKNVSVRNKMQIKDWHKEYNRMLEESNKLKEEAKLEKVKLDQQIYKIEKLEEEIGGENEKKGSRRKLNKTRLADAIKVYEEAIKEYGRLYEHDETYEEGDSTKSDIYEYYTYKQKDKKPSVDVEKEDLDYNTTGIIKESIEERLENISEQYHSIVFEKKEDYDKGTLEENVVSKPVVKADPIDKGEAEDGISLGK